MIIRSKLAEVGLCLESAVAGLPSEPTDAQDLMDRYQEMAHQILDGRCEEFDPIELSEYLESILHTRRMELGLYRDSDIE